MINQYYIIHYNIINNTKKLTCIGSYLLIWECHPYTTALQA